MQQKHLSYLIITRYGWVIRDGIGFQSVVVGVSFQFFPVTMRISEMDNHLSISSPKCLNRKWGRSSHLTSSWLNSYKETQKFKQISNIERTNIENYEK